MAAVARKTCQKVWDCATCVANDCVLLISEDVSSGCYSSIVGRPQIKKQLKTLQDCKTFMGNRTIGGDFVGDLSNDLAEILGSGTVGILIGVLVTFVVCCYFLRRQRPQREGQDPEMAANDDNGGFRIGRGGTYSPRNVLRAIGNGLRAGAMVSRVVQQFTRQRQNDQVPLVANEQVEHPVGTPQRRNQGEENGRGRRGRGNNRPRNILRAAQAGVRVGAMVSQVARGLFQIGRRQNEQDYPAPHPIEGFENIAMDNLARAEQRPPPPDQNQLGRGADRADEPPEPLLDPARNVPDAGNVADGVEDYDNEDAGSNSTDSTLVPGENDGDLIFYDALSDATESPEASGEDSETSERDDSLESAAGNSGHEVEEIDDEEESEEAGADESEAGSSFSIGSRGSTPSRRIQPTRTAKTESNEMIKALRKHKLI